MDQAETITFLREILKPLGVHDAEDTAERLFLDHGSEAANTHRAILLRDAVELCRTPLGGEDSMGLTWRVDCPKGLTWFAVEFDYAGDQSHLTTVAPFNTDKIERDFLNPDRHVGEGAGVIIDYVMEQLDVDDRDDIWQFVQDDCLEFQKFMDSAENIKSNCDPDRLLREACNTGIEDAVVAALDLGANPNALDLLSNCAMHFAAAKGYDHLIKPLLDAGARIDEIGSFGRTPLHYAASGSHARTCLLLMAHGAQTNIEDITGRTAIEVASRRLEQSYEQAPSL